MTSACISIYSTVIGMAKWFALHVLHYTIPVTVLCIVYLNFIYKYKHKYKIVNCDWDGNLQCMKFKEMHTMQVHRQYSAKSIAME